jgi:anti-sigma regulatory factor (Ser/Thr protein kinase)
MGDGPEQRTTGTGRAGVPFTTELPCSPDSAAQARRLVAHACETWHRGGLCDSVELVTTELVANAVRHARSRVRLVVRPTSAGLLVEVSDDSPRLPERREPGLFDESGRGLWLVDAMARRWGVERELPGKRVWAELADA